MFNACTLNFKYHPLYRCTSQSILTDEAFEVPTAPVIEAKRSAECVLAWCAKNETKTEAFADELFTTLESCFTSDKKIKVRKEKMWEKFYTLRSTKEFADS